MFACPINSRGRGIPINNLGTPYVLFLFLVQTVVLSFQMAPCARTTLKQYFESVQMCPPFDQLL